MNNIWHYCIYLIFLAVADIFTAMRNIDFRLVSFFEFDEILPPSFFIIAVIF